MTTTFSMTRNQILHKAFRKAGILGEGETLTAEQLSESADDLNLIIKNLEKYRRKLWAVETVTQDVGVASQVSYLGINYGCLISHASTALLLPTDTTYWVPITTTETLTAWASGTNYNGSSFLAPAGTTAIEQAMIHDTAQPYRQIPLDLMNRFEEMEWPDKTETGTPESLYFRRYPTAVSRVFVYPLPNRPLTITYSRIRLLDDLTAAGEFPDVPVTLIAYLIYEVASEIAEEYDREEAKIVRLRAKAQTELALAIRNQKEYSDSETIAPAYE